MAGTTAVTLFDPGAGVGEQAPSADAVAAAREVVARVRDGLPFRDPEIDCVVDRVARNPVLLRDAQNDMSATSAAYGQLLAVGEACVQTVTFAPEFAAAVQRDTGGVLSDEQLRCLEHGYAHLPPDVLSRMGQAAVNATAPGRAELTSQLDGIVSSCGVAHPPTR